MNTKKIDVIAKSLAAARARGDMIPWKEEETSARVEAGLDDNAPERVIRLDDVVIPEGWRFPSDYLVGALCKSIKEVGLLNPITVTKERRLVAGRKRLEAARLLGWREIPAVFVDLDELRRDLATIDENIVRAPLSRLDLAEALQRRKQIYEALHPETGHGKAPGASGGGKRKNTKEPKLGSFAGDTAEKLGVSKTTVKRSVLAAQRIAPEVKSRISGTRIADSPADLDVLAQLEPKDQAAAVDAVLCGRARSVRRAVGKKKNRSRKTKHTKTNRRPCPHCGGTGFIDNKEETS